MAESSSKIATLDPEVGGAAGAGSGARAGAVQEAVADRVSQPNGTIISGRYRIEGVLGSGGMGTVYLVQHTHMRKRFALKMLHAEASQVPELVARFEREAVAMSRADHPNIAIATDFGRADSGAFFLVIEHLDGYSLRDALKQGPMEVRRVAHIARQIASALERTHELGIIHRDLKPENIMLAPKQGDADFVKILDFGLAKLAPEMLDDRDGDKPETGLTRHGSVFGTPRYMAPEQCVGEEVDGRVDLYALGLILYEALSGLHPFDERDPRRMIKHQLFTPIPPFRVRAPGVNIPASLEALVMRAVEKPRGKRFNNATELLTALAEVCEREGILPPEQSARFPAPRVYTPADGTGVRPGPTPRELAADAMATQDDPAAVTADVVSTASTQDLSPAASTQDLSDAMATQSLADAMATQDVSLPNQTQDLPRSDKTQDLPHSDKTQDLPATEVTKPPARSAAADDGLPTPAPFRVDSMPTQPPSGAPRLAERLAEKPSGARKKSFLLLLIPVALLLCLGLVLRRPQVTARMPRPAVPAGLRAGSETALAPPAPPSALATPAELSRGIAAGPEALLQLASIHPTDARLSRALAQAYVARGSGLEALRWQVKALAFPENSVYDSEIMQAATLAMSDADAAESAIALLEKNFGTRGMDVLIALVNKPGLGRAKALLSQSLTKTAARSQASPAALVALDLNQATGCEAKRALLTRAARDGDQRTLQQLKALSVTRGCGVLHRGDCWKCLRKDAALRSAIAAISARASLAR